MIDARSQIADELSAVCRNVRMSKPEGDVTFPLICYSCIKDLPVNPATERLVWRVAVYCNTFEDLIDKCRAIDSVMHDRLGYTLTSCTPDDESKKATDFYMKRLDYSGLVCLESMGVIRNSK